MGLKEDLAMENTPPKPGPERYIRRLKANEKMTFTIYSRTWTGCWTHYDGKHTQPHFKSKQKCMGCKMGWALRWKGYLDVMNADTKQREFLECAPGLAKQFEENLPQGESFRGHRVTVKRGNGDKARSTVQFLSHISVFAPTAVLPKEEDPRDSLMSLWGLDQEVSEIGDCDESPGIANVG